MLYKYRDLNEFTVELVRDGQLWLSRICDLNDPFEGDFKIEEDKGAYVESSRHRPNDIIEKRIDIIKSYRELIQRQFFILSLSSKWSDIVMWSHYSRNHFGCVVGIEFPSEAMENTTKQGRIITRRKKYIHKVKYSTKDLTLPLINGIEGEYYKICLQKSTQWRYENEHRIILHSNTVRAPGVRINLGKSVAKKVIFGARTPLSEVDKFINSVGRSDVLYKRAIFNHGQFKLTIVDV